MMLPPTYPILSDILSSNHTTTGDRLGYCNGTWTAAVAACLLKALHERPNFYSASVYLSCPCASEYKATSLASRSHPSYITQSQTLSVRYHTQATFETYQNVYACSPRRLCMAYGLAIDCVTAAVATH
jgi:hypothetical protein